MRVKKRAPMSLSIKTGRQNVYDIRQARSAAVKFACNVAIGLMSTIDLARSCELEKELAVGVRALHLCQIGRTSLQACMMD